MNNVASLQVSNENNTQGKRQNKVMLTTLWSVQVLLALIFLFAGSSKLLMPIEMMTSQMSVPLPGLFIRFIGVAEVAGALGLILPLLLRIKPFLTPLAASGLVIIMIGATAITLMGGDVVSALLPLVVGLLAIFIFYGRRSYFKAA
ncbi:hypothetical protein KSC_089600 [Ktedonobacter sp. SOSP1-52]|uniref:DoxX family protein n=1 Tax=Ktedonobacter sp. SOSP1-52 TaxID=2778366 RepID=UPI001916A273|nr:DoxX family protein [Ktedonobacter sp. SOSP1-52]GHO70068.1 hypothetical protein KSC_089600 [Ktedonobacter sp. SOSP1-52]